MVVKLDNTSTPIGKKGEEDWYKWSVFLSGSSEDLDKIEFVTYVLHPTFPNPVRKVTNRDNDFSFSTIGWGEFEIKAKIKYQNGEEKNISYWLDLSREKTGQPAAQAGN